MSRLVSRLLARLSRCCPSAVEAVEAVEGVEGVEARTSTLIDHGVRIFVSRLVSRLCRGCVELLCRGVEAGAQAERCDMCELTGGCVLFWVEILWDRWMY